MNKNITGILNDLNLEKIEELIIDNDEKTIKFQFIDSDMDYHEVELLGVDNYHFSDELVYEEPEYHDESKSIKFFDSIMSMYLSLTVDEDGKIVEKSFVEPNFFMNSKDKTVSARAKTIKIDGVNYHINELKQRLN